MTKPMQKWNIKWIPDDQTYFITMEVPGTSGAWICLSIATKKKRTRRGHKNAYMEQERLSMDKGAFTHNMQKLLPNKGF